MQCKVNSFFLLDSIEDSIRPKKGLECIKLIEGPKSKVETYLILKGSLFKLIMKTVILNSVRYVLGRI